MNIFIRFRAALRLRHAIKMANEAYIANNRRYYVMPMGEKGAKLLVIDRANFRRLKMKHYITHEAKVLNLMLECFYHTPHAAGQSPISPKMARQKRMQYFRWVEQTQNSKKQ